MFVTSTDVGLFDPDADHVAVLQVHLASAFVLISTGVPLSALYAHPATVAPSAQAQRGGKASGVAQERRGARRASGAVGGGNRGGAKGRSDRRGDGHLQLLPATRTGRLVARLGVGNVVGRVAARTGEADHGAVLAG